MLELWLVRHGETVWHAEGRVQGQSDPALSEAGEEQARRLGSRLRRTPFTKVVSSDLQRSVQTARWALPDAQIHTDPRLRELDFGRWEGRTWSEVAADDPDALTAWYANPYVHAPTGGERYAALVERTQGWLGSLPKEGRVIAFTHGGPIRSLLYGLTGVPDGHTWRFEVGPTSLTKVTSGEQGAILQTVGDVAHLENAEGTAERPNPEPIAPRLVLVTGGARSGKSRYAEALAAHFAGGKDVLYLATLEALDDEMVRRVHTHRAWRPAAWRTLETPLTPAAALLEAPEKVVLLDCLSGFVSNLVLEHEHEGEEAVQEAVTNAVTGLVRAVKTSSKTVIVVTNEVGSGVVPPYPLGRLFRDALGMANARVAASADAVSLCVVGLPQRLKGQLPEVALEP